jgi:hypothetical protein
MTEPGPRWARALRLCERRGTQREDRHATAPTRPHRRPIPDGRETAVAEPLSPVAPTRTDPPEHDAHSAVAGRRTTAGLFAVTLATLAFQILLTRIFSVTLWYHFAFLAVSLAMLGMTAGAIFVFLSPQRFPADRLHARLAQSAAIFALSTCASLLVHLNLPVETDGSWASILAVAVTCVVFFIPFTASGICVTLALTRFPQRVGALYAADLVGAALGCLSVVAVLGFTDGPTAVVASGWIAAIGAALFASESATAKSTQRGSVAIAGVLGVFVLVNSVLVANQAGLLRVTWTKSYTGATKSPERPLLERWNSHSRIAVSGNPEQPRTPFGWSFSPKRPDGLDLPQLDLDIDASAFTVLTRFDGALEPLEFLRYDVTNLAHYLRDDADVLVIGAGGGRDVLSALVFEQQSVLGVEVNRNILDIVHGDFGDFTGHLDRHPKVHFANDEARSFVARSADHFDVIQISLIDSWAATGAGAFVLTEHSLYTVEAWQTFLEHLKPGGLLTVTRYYFPKNPGTAYRLVALAARALEELGVQNPRQHIALVWLPSPLGSMCTILVSPDPLSATDLSRLDAAVERLDFGFLLTPDRAHDEVLARVSGGGDLQAFFDGFPLDIEPPVDDRPFFFLMLRLRDVLNQEAAGTLGVAQFNMRAISTLGALLGSVTLLTLLCVVAPVALRSGLGIARDAAPWLLVFAGIGVGFMMIEISQMERLIVFLGHPTYALTVVLFVLLLGSGLGSLTTSGVADAAIARSGALRFGSLLLALMLFGFATPWVTETFRSAGTPVRVAASVAILFPIGFLMGMPFPLGLRAATAGGARDLTPWLWGVNGAMGVFASVLAIAVALSAGITTSFWVGFAAYGVAALGWLWATRATTS